MLLKDKLPCSIKYVPILDPLTRERVPVEVSEPANDPEVMLKVSVGSASPKYLLFVAAVTVIALASIAKD